MAARGYEDKTQLTPEEKLIVAYSYLRLGVSQHQLVGMFNVNQGRINDAITSVRDALGWPKKEAQERDLLDTDGQ